MKARRNRPATVNRREAHTIFRASQNAAAPKANPATRRLPARIFHLKTRMQRNSLTATR